MHYRPLGKTGIAVSAVSFGAGPVPALLTRPGQEDRQGATVRRALEAGVNWFDTAATYGDGLSERHLGAALAELGAASRVHVATKVRLAADRLDDIAGQVEASLAGSLGRLRLERVTLLQLHNSVTARRGDLATSITPADVLGPGGVLEAFEGLRRRGLVAHLGLTGLGHLDSLLEVVRSGAFATVQLPYNLLLARTAGSGIDDGPLVQACAGQGLGLFAIRVLAGGALALQEPSDHTRQTKFFPLDLYERDRARAGRLQDRLAPGMSLPEAALRFVLGRPSLASALVGFSSPEQVDEATRWAEAGPLPPEVAHRLVEDGPVSDAS